jgi:hypothetical protein
MARTSDVQERSKVDEPPSIRVLSTGQRVAIAVALLAAAAAAWLLVPSGRASHVRSPHHKSAPVTSESLAPSEAPSDSETNAALGQSPSVAGGAHSPKAQPSARSTTASPPAASPAVAPPPVVIPQTSPPPVSTAPAPSVGTVGGFWASQHFDPQSFGNFGDENAQVIADSSGQFGSVLRVHYPAGSASPLANDTDGTPLGGMQRYLVPIGYSSADRLVLRYSVRFPDHFNFVKGGKLPGLYGGRVTSGRRIPDGENGFSTRYMWRTGGAGEVYAYLPTSQSHGTSFGRGNWKFSTGKWHQIEQQVTLNSVGSPNGEIKVLFDGKQVLDQQGILFRTTDALKIDGVLFSTFFGGGDATWATPVDTYVDFADFSIAPL